MSLTRSFGKHLKKKQCWTVFFVYIRTVARSLKPLRFVELTRHTKLNSRSLQVDATRMTNKLTVNTVWIADDKCTSVTINVRLKRSTFCTF